MTHALPAKRAKANPANTADTIADEAFESARMERVEAKIEIGTFWRVKNGCAQRSFFVDGDVVPIVRTRDVDGLLHQVHVGAHPRYGYDGHVAFLLDDFLESFDPVDATEAAAVRAREVAGVAAEIDAARLRLASPPPMPERVAIAEDGARLGAGSDGLPSVASAPATKAAMLAAASLAAAHGTVLTEHVKKETDAISAAASRLANYHKEQARLIQASAEGVLAYARFMSAGAATVGLFGGEGVEVRTLCDGEPAPPGPLSVFQRMLYLDEEFIAHLAEGGADWRDVDDFEQALTRDAGLRDRLLPVERCVVALRIRRRNKDRLSRIYETIRSSHGIDPFLLAAKIIGAASEAAAEEELDKRVFLLVRNGGRISSVEAPLATYAGAHGFERLFPARAQLERVFERGGRYGEDKRRLTLQDIEMADASEALAKIKLDYKRLVVALWGAHARDAQLFGRFYDETRHRTWLSPLFQRDAMILVHDDEDVLTSGRPSFAAFAATANASLRSGSRVLCNWRALAGDIDRARGFYGPEPTVRSGEPTQIYKPVQEFGLARVSRDDGDLVVFCPAERRYPVFRSRARRDAASAGIDARIVLARSNEREPPDGFGAVGRGGATLLFLCLDSIRAGDLVHYLQSRIERAQYLAYFELFEHARATLLAEEAAQAPLVEAFARDLEGTGRWGRDACLDAALDALRRWRAARAWRPAPSELDKGILAELREIAWHELEASADPAALERLAAEMRARGRELLRWTALGRRRFAYAAPSPAERAKTAFFGDGSAWVVRFECMPDGRPAKDARENWVALVASPPDEKVLAEPGDVASWIGRTPPRGIARARAVAVCEGALRWREAIAALLHRPADSVRAATADVVDYRRNWWRGTLVRFQEVHAIVGAYYNPRTERLSPLTVWMDIDDLRLGLASKDERAAVADVFAGVYAKPENYKSRVLTPSSLDEGDAKLRIGFTVLGSESGKAWLPGECRTRLRRDKDFAWDPGEPGRRGGIVLADPHALAWCAATHKRRVPKGAHWADVFAKLADEVASWSRETSS